MAAMIPMNQSNYSKIERGVQEPSIEQLRRICQILKLDPRYLLDIDEYESISAEDMKLLRDIKEFMKAHSLKLVHKKLVYAKNTPDRYIKICRGYLN
jgi:transcriptional regulator with XRE-family HTH domain